MVVGRAQQLSGTSGPGRPQRLAPGVEQPATLRLEIRVKPGAARTRVSGQYGEGALIVSVSAPPVDGRATEAALCALADALGLKRSDVLLISGRTSRTKVVEVPGSSVVEVARLLAQ